MRFFVLTIFALSLCGVTHLFASDMTRGDAQSIIEETGFSGGLIVEIDCGGGELTAVLGTLTKGMVQGLDTDEAQVRKARQAIQKIAPGGRVSARLFDGRSLPYADNLVNLLIATKPTNVSKEEIMRVLTPLGSAWINGKKMTKPWPPDIDEWTHFLHTPDNNAVARDSQINLPRSIQWKAKPEWGRSHEELASMSATVTARGRIFYIIDEAPLIFIRFPGEWSLVARDAFNGALLWKHPIANWVDNLREFRSGPVHLPRRLVAVGDRVYVTPGLDAPVTAFDAATGRRLKTYSGTEYTEEILVENNMLYLVVGTSESKRKGVGLFEKGEPKPSAFRYITAVNSDTGETVWKHDYSGEEYLLPLTMAVKGNRLVCKTTKGVVCFDSQSGKMLWRKNEPTPDRRMGFAAPTVVITDTVLLCADRTPQKKKNGGGTKVATGPVEWGVGGWNIDGFPRHGKMMLRAYDLANGKMLWETSCGENYNASVDVFVIGDTVYASTDFTGYDLRTGEAKTKLDKSSPKVGMVHHRCYRNKATEKFLIEGVSGIEMFDFEKGWIGNNSWIRGTCQYGIMPANGLLYAPPDACACNAAVKMSGFFAAAPKRKTVPSTILPKLTKGSAYGKVKDVPANDYDWSMYRHDNQRSGATAMMLGDAVKPLWRKKVVANLTQPVVSGETLIVAGIDNHAVYALDANTGEERWSFIAAGRVDSTPTIFKGRVIFGSADGWVYCLSISNGEQVWRFRAAPSDMQVGIDDQLESAWPVHGSVLIQNGILYVTAGRSTYLDGGLVLYCLNPLTGEEVSHTLISDLDPVTGAQTALEKRGSFDMGGVSSDIMSGNGTNVFMKHVVFNSRGERGSEKLAHLFSPTGMLKDPWFVRGFWRYAAQHGTGWGRWGRNTGGQAYGRIICRDNNVVYGYGRIRIEGGRAGHRLDRYHLFAQNLWSRNDFPLIVHALVLGSDNLAVIGTPDIGKRDKNPKMLRFTNTAETLAAFRGERGVQLMILSRKDGRDLFKMDMDCMPVFDGMSAAGGRLYISLKDGSVLCLNGEKNGG